jgi:hypothetical protein
MMRGPLGGTIDMLRQFTWVLALLAPLACSGLSDRQVRAAFHRDNPNAVIHNLDVGEGDSEHAYYIIRYRDTVENRAYRGCWLYAKYPDGKWVLERRSSTPEPAPANYCT